MSANGVSDSELWKRVHDDDENEKEHKKLCTDDTSIKTKPPRKKKFAILLGYNGVKYKGMQINKEMETIELQLIKALYQSGLIKESEFKEIYLTKFQRAARTDKGVSAARQVVSLVMSENFSCEEINALLPSDIRVFSIKRVTKNFNSKTNCDARTYSYLLPTQVLSQEPMSTFMEIDYRISPESIKEVNDILSLYCGTHSFHNFTHKRLFGDPSCKRYIMSFTCGEPFVKGKEFVLLTVKGQSFMLHQIRKMVGTMIAIVRGLVPRDWIQTAFHGENWLTPIAPGEGLFLERIHCEKYDRRYGTDGIHETLTWDDVEAEVNKFREENIISQIIQNELKNRVMTEWVEKDLPRMDQLTRKEKVDEVPQHANEESVLENQSISAV